MLPFFQFLFEYDDLKPLLLFVLFVLQILLAYIFAWAGWVSELLRTNRWYCKVFGSSTPCVHCGRNCTCLKKRKWIFFGLRFMVLALPLGCVCFYYVDQGFFGSKYVSGLTNKFVPRAVGYLLKGHNEWDTQFYLINEFLDKRLKGVRSPSDYRFVIACPTSGKTAEQILDELKPILMKPDQEMGWIKLGKTKYSNWQTVAVEIDKSVLSKKRWDLNQTGSEEHIANPFAISFPINQKGKSGAGKLLHEIVDKIGSPIAVPLRADWLMNYLSPGSFKLNDQLKLDDIKREIGIIPFMTTVEPEKIADESLRKIFLMPDQFIYRTDWEPKDKKTESLYKKAARELLGAESISDLDK